MELRLIFVMLDFIFEWDPEKERVNFRDHGVHFETAVNAFYDYFRMERRDDDSSDNEERWQTMGFFNDVLFVVYAERGDVIRIMSARVAEPFERRIYHDNSETHGWTRVNP
jgi:uncharacterized DUF497 family protein